MSKDTRIAVLIDSDNISAKYLEYILTELSSYGTPTIKRSYGDFSGTMGKKLKESLLNLSIRPMHQYSYTKGKNATDSSLIIDAMDILHLERVDCFCIVSSDSDFIGLATRIRESGLMVIGMGEKKTSKFFVAACDQFKYLEMLETAYKPDLKPEVPVGGPKLKSTGAATEESNIIRPKTLIKTISTIIEKNSDEDDWIGLGELGSRLQKRHPDFDSRNYGYSKLSSLIKSFGVFEVEMRKRNNNSHSGDVYIRIKN